MIEMEIPKDIRKYEAKLIGPLTTRQAICAVIMVALAVISFKAMGDIPKDRKVFAVLIIALPEILIGWIKPYGMPFEKFLQTAFVSNVLSPKRRKYVIQNFYCDKKKQNLKINRKEDAKKAKKRKASKEFIAYS